MSLTWNVDINIYLYNRMIAHSSYFTIFKPEHNFEYDNYLFIKAFSTCAVRPVGHHAGPTA